MLLWIGWYSTQPINTHAPKSAGNTSIHARVFFPSYLRVFSAHYFVKLPPFHNSYPGSYGTHSSPFPTTKRALVLMARKKKLRIKFPSLASPCVELVCIHSTYRYNMQHAGYEALSAVSLCTDALVSGLDLDPNELTRHTFWWPTCLWCIFSYTVSISCDIGIEISSRYWYRCIPKISHDISRILDTIPNTTSKQFRTHTWGYASLPPSWLYTA